MGRQISFGVVAVVVTFLLRFIGPRVPIPWIDRTNMRTILANTGQYY